MKVFFSFLFCWISLQGFSQIDYTQEDMKIFNRYLLEMEGKQTIPFNDLIIETAKFFLGTPYMAATLEKEPERLVVNLRQLDCTTLVESCLALVLTLQEKEPSFDAFCKKLQSIRYRNGEIENYASRLHYTTDWIIENEKQKHLTDITQTIGGKLYPLTLSFMSSHPDQYKQLKSDPSLVPLIHKYEQQISNNKHYIIPKEQIKSAENKIENGDVICFTTSIKGLDVTHIAYAYKVDGMLSFIHASSSANKVIINLISLEEYVNRSKQCTGILVVRANI